jgi:NADH dehydrogenase FAD-containing subunit
VHSRDELLSSEPLSEEFKESVKTALGKTGVEVLLGRRVTLSEPNNTRAQTLSLSTGETLQAEKVIFSTAKPAPHTEYLPKEALDEHGFAKVNPA